MKLLVVFNTVFWSINATAFVSLHEGFFIVEPNSSADEAEINKNVKANGKLTFRIKYAICWGSMNPSMDP